MKISNRFNSLAGLLLLANAGMAQAVPLYYTFEGTFGRPKYPSPEGALEAYSDITGQSVNDPVSYVFLVDDQISNTVLPDGSTRDFQGARMESTSGGDFYRIDYYAELVAGTGLIFEADGSNSNGGNFGGYLAYSPSPSSPYYETPFFPFLNMYGHASNASLNLSLSPYVPRSSTTSYEDFSAWWADSENLIRTADNTLRLYDSEGSNWSYQLDLALTSVTEAPPTTSVPEPSTYLLMSLGLIGMGVMRNRKHINNRRFNA